ncbi:hypothetical protein BH23ACT2_BH23ACT2_16240 [soil metagenome]
MDSAEVASSVCGRPRFIQIENPLPRLRTLAALLAVVTLVAAGCADDESDDPTGAEAPATTDGAAVPDDGVAASVGATDIPEASVTDLYDELASSPQVAPQLEGENSDTVESTLQSQILSQLLVQEIVIQGAAEDYSLEIDQAELDAGLEELVDEAGGDDEFDTQLEAAGFSRDSFMTLELPLTVALKALQDEFGVEPVEGQEPGAEPTEEQAALQSWGSEKFQEADVSVAEAYGTWDPATGQVQPEGMPETAPPGQAPPGGAPPPGEAPPPGGAPPG